MAGRADKLARENPTLVRPVGSAEGMPQSIERGPTAGARGCCDLGVISTTVDDIILSWDSGAERIFGYSAREAIGQPIRMLYPPQLAAEPARIRDLIRRAGAAQHLETVKVRKDGARIRVRLAIAPIQDAAGRIVGFSRFDRDVTELEAARQAAGEQYKLAETFFTHSLNCMVVLDQNYNFVRVNEAYARAAKRDVSEFAGRNLFDLYPNGPKAIFDEVVRSKRPYKASAQSFTFIDQPERGVTYWDWNLVPILDACLEVEYLVFSLSDVTERQRAEEENRQFSRRLLEAQDTERRRVARELHDGTAQELTSVLANLAIVRKTGRLDKQSRENLESALATVKQCLEEVRDISHLLHPPLLEDWGLRASLAWFVTQFHKRTGIAVDLQVSPELRRLSKEVETAVFRIVQEGLNNVFRHSRSSRAAVVLVVDAGKIRLQIVDQGQGMRRAGLGRRRNGSPAAGIGIPGMRERVAQLGGRFEIRSGGRGTTIRVSLPNSAESASA